MGGGITKVTENILMGRGVKKQTVQTRHSPCELEQSPCGSFGGSVGIKQVVDVPVKCVGADAHVKPCSLWTTQADV